MEKKYIPLKELEVYKLARQLSDLAWQVYSEMNWQDRKVIGDQFLTAVDSVGANIAEGYGRYHYLDQIRFYYNSRGSLKECNEHWLELLYERKKISSEMYNAFKNIAEKLEIKLNNFIASTYSQKHKQQ